MPPLDTSTAKERLALTRFEAVSYIKVLQADGTLLADAIRQACARPWPDQHGRYYSFRTLETWWYRHAKRGFAGLQGKSRREDAGQSRSIDPQIGEWIISMIIEHPDTPLSVHYRGWEEHGCPLPSISSVRRFLKAKGYDPRSLKAGRLASGPQKAFEAPAPNDLWMADFAHGPTLRSPEGATISTRLCILVDDHSRLIPFAAYYPQENTASFLHTLKEAVLRRGLPLKLYTDQGKPFVNHHVRIVCANLGIRLLHAKPYHAWSKGKVERLIRTIQDDFERSLRLPGGQVHSLAELNAGLSHWIAAIYHLREHRATGASPHERFRTGEHLGRIIEDPEGIAPLFYTREERTVRKDGTITLNNQLLEVDLALRALKVELRFDPMDREHIEVWYKDSFHGLARRANLHLNSQTYNRSNNYARQATRPASPDRP